MNFCSLNSSHTRSIACLYCYSGQLINLILLILKMLFFLNFNGLVEVYKDLINVKQPKTQVRPKHPSRFVTGVCTRDTSYG